MNFRIKTKTYKNGFVQYFPQKRFVFWWRYLHYDLSMGIGPNSSINVEWRSQVGQRITKLKDAKYLIECYKYRVEQKKKNGLINEENIPIYE